MLFSNSISNYTTENLNYFKEYFKLKEINYNLSKENLLLKNQLEKFSRRTKLDSLKNVNFSYKNAKIISNNLSSTKNHLIINKGVKHGLKNEMRSPFNFCINFCIDIQNRHYRRVVF